MTFEEWWKEFEEKLDVFERSLAKEIARAAFKAGMDYKLHN